MAKPIFALLMIFANSLAQAQTPSIVGRWKTIDDVSGKPKSIVEIYKDGEMFKGKIAELIAPEEANPLCKECPGDKKNKPVQGIEILWDLKETRAGSEWSEGHIMDPKNGKVYRCRARLVDNGKKLEVRGFLGISLFGRTQSWLRE